MRLKLLSYQKREAVERRASPAASQLRDSSIISQRSGARTLLDFTSHEKSLNLRDRRDCPQDQSSQKILALVNLPAVLIAYSYCPTNPFLDLLF
jgi:hypothetical protein